MNRLSLEPAKTVPRTIKTESDAQTNCRLEATRHGGRLWRNNTGVGTSDTGAVVRFGLCNESPQINATLKSSDLIGIQPVTIQPEHVGGVIGQFVAREMKKPGWRFSGSKREMAQARFLQLVSALGGSANFSTGGYL